MEWKVGQLLYPTCAHLFLGLHPLLQVLNLCLVFDPHIVELTLMLVTLLQQLFFNFLQL